MPRVLQSEVSSEYSLSLLHDFQATSGLLQELDEASLATLAEQLTVMNFQVDQVLVQKGGTHDLPAHAASC